MEDSSHSTIVSSPTSFQEKGKETKEGVRKFPLIKILLLMGGAVLVVAALFVYRVGLTYSVISIKEILLGSESRELFEQESGLHRDPNRINILLIGIRGVDDPHGGLLSDMLMLVSIQKKEGKVALVSIPRDLYVDIPGLGRKERINFAYAFGEKKERGGGGIGLSKRVVSEVTGVYIDYSVSVDFEAFRQIIESLGGIDVYVPEEFVEPTQWGTPFRVLQGWNHMDADTALTYARSRFASSDFDRARREQDILIAIKNRAFALRVLANPLQIFHFLDIVGAHVLTDMDADDMRKLLAFASRFDVKEVERKVFDTSPEGFLYSSRSENGAYILLPEGNSYDRIHETVIHIFE